MKAKNDDNWPDIHELLTVPIDPDMEAYLRRQGLEWLLKRRQQYQDYLKQHKEEKYDR